MGFSSLLSSAIGWMRSIRQAPGSSTASTVLTSGEADARAALYAVNEMLYAGSIYDTPPGGALNEVLSNYIGSKYCDTDKFRIHPWFLPFAEIVDVYQNVLPGVWGDGVKVQGKDQQPVKPKLQSALDAVWRDSNFDTEKSTLIRWAANNGTVGIRIRAQAADGTKPARSVLQLDHPARLFNFEEDDRGNVTAVCLKYRKALNVGTLDKPITRDVAVVEIITKDEISLTYDGREQLADGYRRNGLGFCPYVILRHRDNGTQFGDWAYKGSETLVHRINWRISRQDKSIDRHQFPKWFGAGAGGKPETADMGDESMTYVQLAPDSPTPLLQAIVPQIDQTATQAFWMAIRDLLRGRQPELNLADVKLLAGISGETLAQVLIPTRNRVLEVRPGYTHAIKRALQMAVSAGQSVGAWDLGTGTTAEGADAAFREGLEEFDFAPMPPLPETPQQRLVNAQASVAEQQSKFTLANSAPDGVSDRERLRLGGYSDPQIAAMAEEDELPTVDHADAVE